MTLARWLRPGATSDSPCGAPRIGEDKVQPMHGLNELREQGRMSWIEGEHGWGAAPDSVADAYKFSGLERDPYSDDGGES